jgi:hypothetical protein
VSKLPFRLDLQLQGCPSGQIVATRRSSALAGDHRQGRRNRIHDGKGFVVGPALRSARAGGALSPKGARWIRRRFKLRDPPLVLALPLSPQGLEERGTSHFVSNQGIVL